MSATVQIGRILIGGAANCVGVFNGQNMQNDWDSHAPNLSAFAGIHGDHCMALFQHCTLYNSTAIGQPTFDADTKMNQSPMYIGP
jgi:hypothetical protein